MKSFNEFAGGEGGEPAHMANMMSVEQLVADVRRSSNTTYQRRGLVREKVYLSVQDAPLDYLPRMAEAIKRHVEADPNATMAGVFHVEAMPGSMFRVYCTIETPEEKYTWKAPSRKRS